MALTLSKETLNAEKAGQWFDRLQSLQITRRLGLMAMIAVAVATGVLQGWGVRAGFVSIKIDIVLRACQGRCRNYWPPGATLPSPAPPRARRPLRRAPRQTP